MPPTQLLRKGVLESRMAQPCQRLGVRFYVKSGHSLSITAIKMRIATKWPHGLQKSKRQTKKGPTNCTVEPFFNAGTPFVPPSLYLCCKLFYFRPMSITSHIPPQGIHIVDHINELARDSLLLVACIQFALQIIMIPKPCIPLI